VDEKVVSGDPETGGVGECLPKGAGVGEKHFPGGGGEAEFVALVKAEVRSRLGVLESQEANKFSAFVGVEGERAEVSLGVEAHEATALVIGDLDFLSHGRKLP
jgi:hypothetical protein